MESSQKMEEKAGILEIALKLKKTRGGIPIILCTGYSNQISKEADHEMGIKAFIHKPFFHISSPLQCYDSSKPQPHSDYINFEDFPREWLGLDATVEFEGPYEELLQQQYGFYRSVISHVVYKYLECGDLHQGFARVKCPDCQHEYLLAFSCRGCLYPVSRSSLTFPPVITKK